MAEGRELKFKFVVDEASARQVNTVFDNLIKKAQELSKTIANIGGGGFLGGGLVGGRASPQSTIVRGGNQTQKVSFASVLGQNADAFKKMADTGGSAMKVMTDALKRGVTDQQRELKNLDGTIAALSKRYEQLNAVQSKSIMSPARAEAFFGGQRANIQEEMVQAQGRRSELVETGTRLQKLSLQARASAEGYGSVEEMYAADAKAAGLGGGGFMGRMRGLMGRMGGAGKMVGGAMAVAAAANILSEAGLAVGTSQAAFQADRNRLFKAQMSAIRGGDLTYGLANIRAQRDMTSILGLGDVNAMQQHSSGILSGVTTLIGGGLGAAKQLVGAAVPAIGGAGSVGGAIRAVTPQGLVNQRVEGMMNTLDTYRQAITPQQEMALGEFAGSVGARIRAQRILGMGGFGRTGKFQNGMAVFSDPYGEAAAALQEKGYSLEEKEQGFLSIRSLAGAHAAGRYASAAMAATAGGYGGYEQAIAASMRLVGSDVLARGALKGIDTTAGIQLAQSVLGSGFDITGQTSMMGTMAAIQAGGGFTNSTNDFNRVQTMMAGLQFGNTITQGGLDPYQQGRNLVNAMGIVPGGSSYTQDYLANGMSMKQMIDMARPGSKMTETAKALGLTPENIREQLSGQMTSVFDRFVDQGKADPMSQEIRNFRASKMNITEYLQKLRSNGDPNGAINTLGVAFSQLTGGNEGEGIGLSRILSGMDSSLKTRRYGPGGGAPRGAEADYLKAQGELSQSVTDTLKGLGDNVNLAAKSLPEMFKTFKGATSDMTQNAEKINTALKSIADTLVQASIDLDKRMRGIPVPVRAGAKK